MFLEDDVFGTGYLIQGSRNNDNLSTNEPNKELGYISKGFKSVQFDC